MIRDVITLSEERKTDLTVYRIEDNDEYQQGLKRPMVVICPGGGYVFLSKREAEPIALRYLAAGFHAAVLHYGICEYAAAPGPLKDIAAAVALLREHAGEWQIDPDWIYVSGFSAGGHVACSLGVFWNNRELLPEFDPEKIRPNGMILAYPVIDLTKSSSHLDLGIAPGADPEKVEVWQKHPKIPIEKLLVFDSDEGRYFYDFNMAMNPFIFDGEYTGEQAAFYSLQNRVTPDTCPAFIWHCWDDGLILPENSLELARALKQNGVSAELHIYSGGGHGYALSDYVTAGDRYQHYPYAADWMQHSIDWVLKQTGYEESIRKKYLSGE